MTILIYESVRSGPIADKNIRRRRISSARLQKIAGADGKGPRVDRRGGAATRSGPSPWRTAGSPGRDGRGDPVRSRNRAPMGTTEPTGALVDETGERPTPVRRPRSA